MITSVLCLLLLVNPMIGYYYCCAHNEFIMADAACPDSLAADALSSVANSSPCNHSESHSDQQSGHQSEHSCLIHSQALCSAPLPRMILDWIQTDWISETIPSRIIQFPFPTLFANYTAQSVCLTDGVAVLSWFCILII